MLLRFCQILGISSGYVQGVFRVCSKCVQSVFSVCSVCVQSVFRVCSEQGGITCGAIDEPRKSSKAIDKRVIINFRDKNVIIARFCYSIL